MVRKLHILHGHSDEQQTKLLNLVQTVLLRLVSFCHDSLADDVHVGLVDVVGGDVVEFELE